MALMISLGALVFIVYGDRWAEDLSYAHPEGRVRVSLFIRKMIADTGEVWLSLHYSFVIYPTCFTLASSSGI